MVALVHCTHEKRKKVGSTKAGTQRYKCLSCGKKFTDGTLTLAGMRIGVDKSAQIIAMLCEGLSVRATARLSGTNPETILDLLVLVGQRCKDYMDGAFQGIPVQDLQIDELWSFVRCKERTRKLRSYPVGSCGDIYCFTALEASTKLLVCWHMGERSAGDGLTFVRKLKRACASGSFQISSDGWRPYKHLIPNVLTQADYGMVIKIFNPVKDTRYSPAQIVEVKRKTIAGQPDDARISTSYCERFNLSIRMGIRRFTRLTNCFSRKHENHEAALALFFMHYNFCQRHGTLKATPAVAAKLTDHRWTVAEMIENTASYVKPEPRPRTWEEIIGGEIGPT